MFRPLKMFQVDSIETYLQPQTPQTDPFYFKAKSEQKSLFEKISNCSTGLLRIIQYESTKNNLHLKFRKTQKNLNGIFEISLYKELLFDDKISSSIVTEMFCVLLGISIKVKKSECTITWEKENPFLCFQPEFPLNSAEMQDRYLRSFYQNKTNADVILEVYGEKIPVHKVFLERFKYFEIIFKNQEASRKQQFKTCARREARFLSTDPLNTIVFNQAKPPVIHAMLFFCYTSQLEEKDKQNANLILELYQLGRFLLCDDLVKYCAASMNSLINSENFLSFAYIQDLYEDEYLLALIEWFLAQNPDLKKLNISCFTARQALDIYSRIRKYGDKDLCMQFIRAIIDKLRLELSSNELFTILEQKSKAELHEWISQYALKESSANYSDTKIG